MAPKSWNFPGFSPNMDEKKPEKSAWVQTIVVLTATDA